MIRPFEDVDKDWTFFDWDEWETKYFVKLDVDYLQLLNFTISGHFEDLKKVKADLKRFVKTKYPDLSFSFNE